MYLLEINLMISQWKFLTKSDIKMKLLITHGLISSKRYTFKFGDFMSLGNLAENIYNGNVSLDPAKQE